MMGACLDVNSVSAPVKEAYVELGCEAKPRVIFQYYTEMLSRRFIQECLLPRRPLFLSSYLY